MFAQNGTLVVVEVKTGRAGPLFRPGARFGRESLARRVRAARALARGAPSRVDLIEVQLDQARHARLVHHVGLRRPL